MNRRHKLFETTFGITAGAAILSLILFAYTGSELMLTTMQWCGLVLAPLAVVKFHMIQQKRQWVEQFVITLNYTLVGLLLGGLIALRTKDVAWLALGGLLFFGARLVWITYKRVPS